MKPISSWVCYEISECNTEVKKVRSFWLIAGPDGVPNRLMIKGIPDNSSTPSDTNISLGDLFALVDEIKGRLADRKNK